jgi:2,3-bisphosphoglycerate-independent phosphoglycerate mutase
MNGTLVTAAVIESIGKQMYKLIVCNYANVDATGHTGNVTAVRIAAEFVDSQITKIWKACQDNDYILIITSDHGNGEEDTELDGSRRLYHTVNNVPFVIVSHDYEIVRLRPGQAPFIGNVAASVLTVLGIDIPPEMEPSIVRPVGIRADLTSDVNKKDLAIGFCFAAMSVILAAMWCKLVRGSCSRFESPRDYQTMSKL